MAIRNSSAVDHAAVRPDWTCSCGDQRWPCPDARMLLLRTTDPCRLSTRAGDWMREAARDLSDVTPAELFERFLSWTRDCG
ncbi:hypothetical protein [Plantactinospora soyae]|uniref:Flavin reductase n=1 Tax=Plantactinospora soyae TaxID=1544732 RepID=A0A927M906_9ACTN|nr:hypothetical protein [Plantactinospora soyae]MBE1488876.1 hypothetical protein [Plantactinospora soyae]